MKYNGQKLNRTLKELFIYKGISYCEAQLPGCNNFNLTFAHRHKRRWYQNNQDLLSDYQQVILACLKCHMKMEADADLTKIVFERKRGPEN